MQAIVLRWDFANEEEMVLAKMKSQDPRSMLKKSKMFSGLVSRRMTLFS
jgi:hypothetical protein